MYEWICIGQGSLPGVVVIEVHGGRPSRGAARSRRNLGSRIRQWKQWKREASNRNPAGLDELVFINVVLGTLEKVVMYVFDSSTAAAFRRRDFLDLVDVFFERWMTGDKLGYGAQRLALLHDDGCVSKFREEISCHLSTRWFSSLSAPGPLSRLT